MDETDSKRSIEEKIEFSKKCSVKDAAFVSGTIGFGDSYISAYALEVGASIHQIGMLTSIPNIVAPFAQIFSNKLMKKYSRRKILSFALLWQSLMWIPIILVSLLFLNGFSYSPILVVLFFTLYAFFANLSGPAWVSWTGDLLRGKDTGKFFARRSRVGVFVQLFAMAMAGIILYLFNEILSDNSRHLLFFGYAIIFLLAMIFRLASRYYVLKQYEPKFKFQEKKYFSFFQFIKKMPQRNYSKFVLYVALITFSVNIIAPYYVLYMFKNLGFSYFQYMLVIVSSLVATFLFAVRWGKFTDRTGNIKTLRISGLLIPLVPFLWLITLIIPADYVVPYLICVNFFSGFAWVGFNLAAGNFVYEAVTPQRRGLCSAYSAILNGIGVVLGASLGSFIISNLGISFINPILFAAIISGVFCFLVYLLVLRKVREIR